MNKSPEDLVICKCGSQYRSTTQCSVVNGAKVIVTTKRCPMCSRNDNWQILTSSKVERVPPTIEEDMAWKRMEMEGQTKPPHYPKDCFEIPCDECDPAYKKPVSNS